MLLEPIECLSPRKEKMLAFATSFISLEMTWEKKKERKSFVEVGGKKRNLDLVLNEKKAATIRREI